MQARLGGGKEGMGGMAGERFPNIWFSVLGS